MGSITVYALGQIELGIGHSVGDLPPYSSWRQYELPDSLYYWRMVGDLAVDDIVCVAWSPDGSHHVWDVYMWPGYWPVRMGLYVYGSDRLEWVDDVVYISHVLAGRVLGDLLPSPLYYWDEDWDRAWEITDMSRLIVWYPESFHYPGTSNTRVVE